MLARTTWIVTNSFEMIYLVAVMRKSFMENKIFYNKILFIVTTENLWISFQS